MSGNKVRNGIIGSKMEGHYYDDEIEVDEIGM